MSRFLKTFFLLRAIWIVALLTSLAHGQIALAGTQPETVVDILHDLSEKADIIFAGQVLAVRTDSGVVEVEFRVDHAIRGCTAGTPYILREWAGLWAGDSQRYRVGQRLLMLLHAPSTAGMSSPVGGLDGAIPIRQGGLANPSTGVATPPPQPPYVDLRWLGAKLTRAVSYRSEPVRAARPANQSEPFFDQQAAYGTAPSSMSSLAPSEQTLDDLSPSEASVPAQQASVNAVMGMLSSWQKAHHVAP